MLKLFRSHKILKSIDIIQKKDNFFLMRFLLSLYEICEDIKIQALSNIMPTKGDIMRGN